MTDTEQTGAVPAARPQALRPSARAMHSPAAKFFLTGAITVLLIVPLWMVFALTGERQSRRDEVAAAIGRDWGPAQSVYGPLLVVPYLARVRDGAAGASVATRHLVVLPETMSATVEATAEERSVSVYTVPVYASRITAAGRFGAVDPALFGADATTILWDRAYLSVSLADLGGIEDAAITLDGGTLAVEPGASANQTFQLDNGSTTSVGAGIHAPLGANGPIAGFDYDVDLRVRGTGALTMAPVGRQSAIAMTSNWPHPSFAVGMLPSEREIGGDGFRATWRIPYLARPAPQSWTIERDGFYRFSSTRVGAGFVEPVDFYALVERSLKYCLMFIGVTFLTVFMLETLSPHRVHIVQYCLVGLVLVMFFVLLLALSERIGFGPAYVAAAAATTVVVSAFVGLVLESRARAVIAAAVFATTFGLLYAVLRLEDLALLAGSVIGFVALSGLLFATRKVDWSGFGDRVAGRPAAAVQ